ncbi:MAG: sugar transferase [Malacoplasma sp.]
MYKNYIKRWIDVIISMCFILIFSPIYLILYILVRYKMGAPVIFKQERPGEKNKIFEMYKFRTMNSLCDTNGQLLPDEVRLTKFGKFMRSTSLDELPELFNILKGDMSLIGPRPLLVEYLPLYDKTQIKRHNIKPGLTGWAQINGRNTISWNQKFEYDVWYVEHVNFVLDMKILLLTLVKVFKRDGINADGEATMNKFEGVNSKWKIYTLIYVLLK